MIFLNSKFYRLGWRWAFLIQVPFFCLAFAVTAWNLNYVTEVGCSRSWSSDFLTYDRTGKGKERQRNLETDWLLWESFSYAIGEFLCTFHSYRRSISIGSKVGATLVFLSVRYNESLPASSLQPHINPVLTPIQSLNPAVIISITLACILAILFFIIKKVRLCSPKPINKIELCDCICFSISHFVGTRLTGAAQIFFLFSFFFLGSFSRLAGWVLWLAMSSISRFVGTLLKGTESHV